MKKKTKKIIGFSVAILLVAALLAWHLLPIVTTKWFFRESELQNTLKLTPIQVKSLPLPPKEWDDIIVDQLAWKMPLSRFKKVVGKETTMSFISDTGSIVVEIIPAMEIQTMAKEKNFVTYQQTLAIAYVVPTDVSFFNSPKKNMSAAIFLPLKAISLSAGRYSKMFHVDTGNLKAMCYISKRKEKGFTAAAYVYSQDEATYVSFDLVRYKDENAIEADLFAILGGIQMPGRMLEPGLIREDIAKIVAKRNKT